MASEVSVHGQLAPLLWTNSAEVEHNGRPCGREWQEEAEIVILEGTSTRSSPQECAHRDLLPLKLSITSQPPKLSITSQMGTKASIHEPIWLLWFVYEVFPPQKLMY
jgi:hypothetical protein